jgi:hypothetical protein
MPAIEARTAYRISIIDHETARRVRETMVDGFGNQLYTQVCDSPVPCRSCLRLTAAGEEVILLAYRPFQTEGPYAEVGPVFIHAHCCDAYVPADVFPEDFMTRRLVLRAYNSKGEIVDAEVGEPGEHNSVIKRLFENGEVQFIHARNVAYGCYLFRIERA